MSNLNEQNPFWQPEELWVLALHTHYKYISLIEDFFEEKALATSSYEISSETVESMPDDHWVVEIYLPYQPSNEIIPKNLENIIEKNSIKITRVENKDWTAASLASLGEIRTNKFHIIRSQEDYSDSGLIPIILNQTRAFGTGEHATTIGCLEALERYSKPETQSILDVGTGTGILAIVAKKLCPHAHIVATDIDPVAIEVAKDHAVANEVELEFLLADGLSERNSSYKYDIIVANILARPLIDMSKVIANLIKPQGIIILSGFLENQKDEIIQVYEKHGLSIIETIIKNQWVITVFQCR